MAQIGIRALKQNASQVIATVVAGQTVTITDRGRPVAQMSPLGSGRLAALHDSGRTRPPRRDLRELAPPVDLDSRKALSAELAAMRDDERY